MIARSTSALLFWLGLTIAASLMLYHTSDRVHALDQQLKVLNAQIDGEQQSLHILKAEWVYLANPARVEAATHRHLALQPTAPRRVVALQDIASLLPLREGSEPVFASREAPPDKAAFAEQENSAPQVQVTSIATAPPVEAKAEAAPVKTQSAAAVIPARHKPSHVFATLNEGRINDHMIMQHTVSPQQASTDSIGTLIASLSLRP